MLYVTLDNINNGFLMHNEVSNLKYCYLAHFASFKSWTKISNSLYFFGKQEIAIYINLQLPIVI